MVCVFSDLHFPEYIELLKKVSNQAVLFQRQVGIWSWGKKLLMLELIGASAQGRKRSRKVVGRERKAGIPSRVGRNLL